MTKDVPKDFKSADPSFQNRTFEKAISKPQPLNLRNTRNTDGT